MIVDPAKILPKQSLKLLFLSLVQGLVQKGSQRHALRKVKFRARKRICLRQLALIDDKLAALKALRQTLAGTRHGGDVLRCLLT